MPKKGIFDFMEMKRKGEKITWLTCYDHPTARLMDQAGLDMILVGDSVGLVVYGYPGVEPVTMDQMIYHSEAVHRGAPNVFVIGDMPFLSYHKSVEDAIINAGRFYKEAGVDAIALEGGKRITPQIRGIVDAGMVVIGHIGFTPQSSAALGGFKTQADTAESAMVLVEDAKAVQEAGGSMLLLEAVPEEVAKIVTESLRIPTIGLGAGAYCDGQLLLVTDMLGIVELFTAKSGKKYTNFAETMLRVFEEYIRDVREGKFPGPEHSNKMQPREAKKMEKVLRKTH
jgi:3-methyl-2-oxobutanoate hydroxymethyltransferase